MADRQAGWHTSDRKRCRRSPHRRSPPPEPFPCPPPPPFRFLSSVVLGLCSALCGSVKLWKSERKDKDARSDE